MDLSALRRLIGDVEDQYGATRDTVVAHRLTRILDRLYTTYAQGCIDALNVGVDLVALCADGGRG